MIGRNWWKEAGRLPRRHALRKRENILQEKRDAGKATLRCRARRHARVVIILEYDGVQLWLKRFGAGNRLIDKFSRRYVPAGNELSKPDAVIIRELLERHLPHPNIFDESLAPAPGTVTVFRAAPEIVAARTRD